MKQNVKRLPYGINDFEAVIEQNQYYVDKTMYLPLLENQPSNIIFIRPRRFGKSIFLSMLHAYYDCSKKEKFQTLFGDLWVGKHPTPLQGKYQVLHLDFSYVGGSIDKLEENFDMYLRVKLDGFMRIYQDSYLEDFKEKFYKSDSATEKLALLQDETATKSIPLYLIIDEYDNFTNTVLNEQGEKVYWAITHADGFYRDVFKKFKGMFERIFITGVSPVTLDDVTSGFNIGWHISTKPEFNQMLGFSLEEVRKMFAYYKEVGGIPATSDIEVMIDEMKPWYDNYCFSEDALKNQSKVFNCDMVIYYLRNYMDRGEAPKQMIDPNTMTDYNKMKKLLLLDKLDGNRKGIIRTIAETGQIVTSLENTFPASRLTNPQTFTSLLFYYGMLTIKDTFGDMLILGIPNNNVRKQYYGYLLEQYQEEKFVDLTQMKILFTYMALEGKWRDALEAMAKAYEDVSSVRDGIESERNLQGFFMAYLNLNNYYYTAPELELNHGYCDFFLLPNLTHYATKHSYILELKVLSKKDYEAKPEDGKLSKAEVQWQEAEGQVRRYAMAPRVEALRQGTTLHKIIMQFVAGKLVRMEEVVC
ncbi:AAA family ATPase [Prevotella sp. AM23-5]|uniref:ATP-binding protein n=1 Tax=Prevotellaceae TaxID=171552 RepID=UPI000E4A75FE|nr:MULTISPECIES: ATP-binding protein [Prevotellaceae]RHN90769.1 AAA family ATPase [Prevotella sp. AM23-5]